MMARLYKMVLPVFEQEERLRVVGLLRVITIVLASLAAIYLILSLILPGLQAGGLLALGFFMVALLVTAIVRWGHVRFAALLLISVLWVLITLPALGVP